MLENVDVEVFRMNKNFYILYSNPEYEEFEGTYQLHSLCCEWKRSGKEYYELIAIGIFSRLTKEILAYS